MKIGKILDTALKYSVKKVSAGHYNSLILQQTDNVDFFSTKFNEHVKYLV